MNERVAKNNHPKRGEAEDIMRIKSEVDYELRLLEFTMTPETRDVLVHAMAKSIGTFAQKSSYYDLSSICVFLDKLDKTT